MLAEFSSFRGTLLIQSRSKLRRGRSRDEIPSAPAIRDRLTESRGELLRLFYHGSPEENEEATGQSNSLTQGNAQGHNHI
jgi:hypothetical protein